MQNRFRYCGEQYDSITGQYYLRARYYNPVIGRFLQEDTYYKDGLNLYSYCKNNPVYYADPSGHEVTPATQRLTGDQQALFDIAGELNGKGGASVDDAAIMMQWAAQYGVPYEKLQLQNQLLLEGPTTTQKPSNGNNSKFRYEHNPSDNPKVLQDALEDSNAVYGYSPNPNSESIGNYANSVEKGIDWSNPEKVAEYRTRREIYHMKNDNIDELVIEMTKKGLSSEEIARAANMQRNQNRLNDYIINNDMEGLARVKERNLIKYGYEFGLDADDAYKMYGSWEKVIEKSKSANPGMDACCGLYDKYYHLYETE